ncbi:MAG TPA: NAD-dependent epimerase/dehydratase family protein [Pseudonocardia sp.]|nr:NAD-dependent epimerase/dehydratase family protein [Pseudonocardia sp.]
MLMVTGASGYLGSAVVGLAVREGRAVRAVVRDPDRAVGVLPAGVEVAVADLADPEALRAAARGCTGVLHVAGSVGGPADDVRRANVDGTRAVLAAAVAAGVPRFVLTSSSAAVIDATGLVAEEPVGPPALTDPYSTSKAAAEELVLAASGRGDIEAVVAAPVSIYGPSPRGPESYNSLFVAAALGTEPVVVDSTVGWILAEDAAAGHLLALDRGAAGRRYVLSGEVATFGRILHAFADLVGGRRVATLPPGAALGPEAGTFARRSEVYGRFPPVRVADAGARGLGLAPRRVADGIALTADWIGPLAAH